MYILHQSDSNEVQCFQYGHHSNINKDQANNGLCTEMKVEIENIFVTGITQPERILRELARKEKPIPEKQKLIVFLRQLRKQHCGERIIHLNELEKWCVDNSNAPNNDIDCFVMRYETDYQNQSFRIFFTSKKLMSFAEYCNGFVQTDSTYKLNFNMNNKFRHFN